MKYGWGVVMIAALLSGCASEPQLQKMAFTDLPGWGQDPIVEAVPAYQKSCKVLLRKQPKEMFGYEGAPAEFSQFQKICEAFLDHTPQTSSEFQEFLTAHFDVYHIQDENGGQGLFTGYYEPFVEASRTPNATYATPVYLKPNDLLVIEDLGLFKPHMKGERLAGRLKDGKLLPYPTRKDIEAGALQNRDLEIAWVKDPVDLFFLHIQGSGRLVFEDGSIQGIGYDGTNGRAYFAVGKALLERGHLSREDLHLEGIRGWLRAHPEEGREIMHLNPSYVFFKRRDTQDPVGSQGVELTPERSLAIDRKWVELGNLLWLDAAHPREDARLQRLMVAQDTGGAIKGPVRGDYYWGSGPTAETMAGPMKSRGTFYLLLPKGR